jgi:methionine-rich copper-binding protein CopC
VFRVSLFRIGLQPGGFAASRRVPGDAASKGRQMKRSLVLAVLAFLTLVSVSVGPASAHTQLVASDPAAGSTVRALPESVKLTFAEDLVTQPGGEANHVTVVDPMHETISALHTDLEGAVASTVLSPSMVMDGSYQVSFRVVGGDGHAVEGSFTFTVDANASSPDASTIDDSPASGKATLLATATGAGIPGGLGAPTGTALGSFDVDLTLSKVCYRIVTQGIQGMTAAHVHSANTSEMTISDEIYLPIDLTAVDKATPVCAPAKRRDLLAFVRDPSRYVLMIHTAAYPEGAASGTFRLVSTLGLELPPPPDSRGSWVVPLVVCVGVGLLVAAVVGEALGRRRRPASAPHATATAEEPS